MILLAGAGIEPALHSDGTVNLLYSCEFCVQRRAARALRSCRPEWLEVALNDADLQRVLEVWPHLPEAIRRVILILVGLPTEGPTG
jgi:hypothetical protein